MHRFAGAVGCALSIILAACEGSVVDPASNVPTGPAYTTYDPDGGGGTPTEAEIMSALQTQGVQIVEATTNIELSASSTSAFSFMRFKGTRAEAVTTHQLYLNNVIKLVTLSPQASYESTMLQLGVDAACIMAGGDCTHTLSTSMMPISLSQACGYRVDASSSHSASSWYNGFSFGNASKESVATSKSQPPCAPPPNEGVTGGGGGEGGACMMYYDGGSCTEGTGGGYAGGTAYICRTVYYPETYGWSVTCRLYYF